MATFADTSGHAGDEGNFEALYETYKSDVQRLASYLLRNATDAEDAAQTVFLNVLRALRQGVTPTDPRAWLLAITRNVCFSRRRAASARPVQVELEPELMPSEPDADAGPSADEIVGALARLLPNQRTALILRDFRGVSRPEICSLMALSPVALEALLTRSRAAFREELEAGEQPFACEETRVLVEQQLDGLITVADRHSLRTHLRHCASCSTLARAVRSSRGKLAGLLFWPSELISRLVSAFSQAPTAGRVAAAITSSAAIATIAIPAAVSTGPSAAHIEGRTAPGPVVAAVHHSQISLPSLPSLSHVAGAAGAVFHTPTKHAVTHATPRKQSKPTHHVVTHHVVTHHVATHHTAHVTAAAPAARPSTTASGGITTPSQPTTSATVAPVQHPGVVVSSTAAPTRSSSPATRPWSKPKTKPVKKAGKKNHTRHGPAPVQQMPASSAPAANMPPADGGAVNGSGSGVEIGAATSSAVVPSSSSSDSGNGGSSAAGAASSSSGSGSSSDGNGNGNNGNGNSGDKDKHKHKK